MALYHCVHYIFRVTGKFLSSSRLMFPEKHVYFLGVRTRLPLLSLAPPPAGMIDRFTDTVLNRVALLTARLIVLLFHRKHRTPGKLPGLSDESMDGWIVNWLANYFFVF